MARKIFKRILLILLVSIPLICLIVFVSFNSSVNKLIKSYVIFDTTQQAYKLIEKQPKAWVKVKEVSRYAKWAIIVSEDWAFYEHNGVDLNQLKTAIEESLDAGKFVRGASTITQQVVKNTLLSPERTLTRKIKEIALALLLEKKASKEKILELYLNLIELGPNLYGINNASQFYFQKPPQQLNAKEGAFLAMLLPSPKRYSQSYRDQKLTDFAESQINEILIKLRQAKIINEDERQQQMREVLSFESTNYFGEDLLDIEKELINY